MKIQSPLAALGFALALGGCATDRTPIGTGPDGSPIYGKSFAPTARDAFVTVNCAVGEDQKLTDCRIANEQPAGSGFGATAISAAMGQKVRARNGAPPGERIDVTLAFRKD